MKVFTAESAISLLWSKASDSMSLQELEWYAAGAAERVTSAASELSAVLEGMACMVESDVESGSFQSARSTSMLLFNLQNQLSTIAGLAEIAAQASHQARQARKGGNK
jgi:hypothetical protein